MSKFKRSTLHFFEALEKEVTRMEKTNPEDALVLKRILSLQYQSLEFALKHILEELEYRPFLTISPQTMLLAEVAIQHAKVWPPEGNYR